MPVARFRGIAGARCTDQILVVTKLMAGFGPVAIGVLARADANERPPCSFDLLRNRHEVAVAANDDDRPDVIDPADVFGGVEARIASCSKRG